MIGRRSFVKLLCGVPLVGPMLLGGDGSRPFFAPETLEKAHEISKALRLTFQPFIMLNTSLLKCGFVPPLISGTMSIEEAERWYPIAFFGPCLPEWVLAIQRIDSPITVVPLNGAKTPWGISSEGVRHAMGFFGRAYSRHLGEVVRVEAYGLGTEPSLEKPLAGYERWDFGWYERGVRHAWIPLRPPEYLLPSATWTGVRFAGTAVDFVRRKGSPVSAVNVMGWMG